MSKRKGMLVTLEGPEGAGKSTQIELLRRSLAKYDPLLLREPGGTALGEGIRQLLLDNRELRIAPEAELHLFLAARAELISEVMEPALRADRLVLVDRYHDSTRVYQGIVGGLQVDWPESIPRPQLTVLLMLPPEVGLERHRRSGVRLDRLDDQPLEFHRQVVAGYQRLVELEPERFLIVNAADSSELIQQRIVERLKPLLNEGLV
ncbi:MAG: dTMP kinase [Candidatus Dormibacteraceae bacterium]